MNKFLKDSSRRPIGGVGGESTEKPDAGTKSEGEDDSQHCVVKHRASLGKTPNHLTLR